MYSNAYTRLREQELAKSTKPFQAKGKSVKRCHDCQLADYACMCEWRPRASTSVDFVLLMHRLELFKPTNTGRLIADTFETCQAFLWHRKEPSEALLSLLHDPKRECYLVFPCQEKPENPRPEDPRPENPRPENPRRIIKEIPRSNAVNQSTKTITFILLDGSWKQCSRMVALSRWLDDVACLSLPESLTKSYLVRDSGRSDRFSTAEAAISCLSLVGEDRAAEVLKHYYTVFNAHYLATRGCYRPIESNSHQVLADLT